MLESSDFENMWSFNHPHLNVKDHSREVALSGGACRKRRISSFLGKFMKTL
jgi:hypothetical protein